MDKSPQLNKNGGQVQRLTSVSPNLTAITQIAQSLGDDPVTELDADGLPNRRLSSVGISELTTNILRAVPNTKGAKFSILLAARVAFLVRHFTLPLPAYTHQVL